MTIILFLYKYLWLIVLIILYTLGWIHTIQQIRAEWAGEEIYDSVYNPFPFYVFWIFTHGIILLTAVAFLIISSFNYWLTGQLSFK